MINGYVLTKQLKKARRIVVEKHVLPSKYERTIFSFTNKNNFFKIISQMNVSINQIIAYLQLFSKEDVFILCRNALENEISLVSVKDMSDYICLCIDKKMIYAKKKPKLPEIQRSLNLANCIIDDSEKKDIKIVSHFDRHFPPSLKRYIKINAMSVLWFCITRETFRKLGKRMG
jgi:hypothetical protein